MVIQFNRVILIFLLQVIFVARLHGQQTSSAAWISELMDPFQTGRVISDDSWLINTQHDTVKFSQLKGKWVIIDYRMTGCKLCIQEFPVLEAHDETIDKSKLEIIRVSIDRSFE